MNRRVFIIYTVIIVLLFTVTTAFCDGELSQGTSGVLIKRYGLFLVDKKGTIPWSEEEGVYILGFLGKMPKKLTKKGHKIELSKVSITFSEFMDDEYRSDPGEVAIFSKADITKTFAGIKDRREKEIALFLINNNLVSPNGKGLQKNYLSYMARSIIERYLQKYDEDKGVSNKDCWLKLSYWKRSSFLKIPIPFGGMCAENSHLSGFAHPKGMESPMDDFLTFGASFFATPITYFVKSIKCVNPEKYRFFKKHFPEFTPHLDNPEFKKRGIACQRIDQDIAAFTDFTDLHTRGKIEIGPINENSVKGFELIYATPGDREISEIAGHLMLRVKLDNNPENTSTQNPYDLTIAVLADNNAFFKNSGETKNSMTKSDLDPCSKDFKQRTAEFDELLDNTTEALLGLVGGFRTIFQVDTFQYAVNHYTVDSNRTLERFELILNDSQKRALIKHLTRSVKNYKTDYYFFHKNCGSILIKLIGEALKDDEIATYNTLVSPPNSLISLLIRKGLAKPVYPHIYSYTAKAQIASDMIRSKTEELKDKFPKENFPDYDSMNSKDDEVRSKSYQMLYQIALKNMKVRPDILNIFKIAQRSELTYTWNKGICIRYSTKTKGIVRSYINKLSKPDDKNIDLTDMINTYNRENEIKDSKNGTGHTGLSVWKTGAIIKKQESQDDELFTYISGTVYQQKMGDVSNRTMLRGTSVDLGHFEFDYNDKSNGWKITGLKIRKIKERRDYIPSIFSIHRKFGMGFTLLDVESLSENGDTYKIVPGEIEGFVSLCSSRLFLDYLIVGGGVSLETNAEKNENPLSQIFSRNTTMGFPLRLEAQLTFGESRFMQLNWGVEYKHNIEFPGKIEETQPEKEWKCKVALDIRLGEIMETSIVLNTSYTYKAFETNNDIKTDEEVMRMGLSFFFW
jgi:hypothetical protein